jgi:hypothetical protein
MGPYLVHGGITHEVTDAAMADQACCIQILPVLDANQIRSLGRQGGVGAVAREDAGRNRAMHCRHVFRRHSADIRHGIIGAQPERQTKVSPRRAPGLAAIGLSNVGMWS